MPPEQGIYALRAGLYEFANFVDAGLSEEAFQITREFLSKFVNVLTQTLDENLGYKLDSLYYKIPEYTRVFKGISLKAHSRTGECRDQTTS